MEEVNQKSIQEQVIQQGHDPVLPAEATIMVSKKNWKVIILAIFLGLLIIVGAIYWWILKGNNSDVAIVQDSVSNKEVLDNVVEEGEKTIALSLAEKCDQANGVWGNGKCKAKNCFDADARLGDDSKYFSYGTNYSGDLSIFSEEYRNNNSEYSTHNDVCRDSVLREATCPIEINTQEDFSNSYVEYKCDEGCDGNIGRCKKSDYNIAGSRIINLDLMHYDYNKFDGDYAAYLGPNGTVSYKWGEYAPGAAILSEKEYGEIHKDLIKMEGLFIEVEGYDADVDLKDNSYYSFENKEKDEYFLQYTYYPEGVEKNTGNKKIKKFACNINCPQDIVELFNKLEKKTPFLAASDKHWVPQFIYNDQCRESNEDLACLYRLLATEKFTAILGDYSQENIFFLDVDHLIDSDGDGISDLNEKYLGTDMRSSDTDSDGYLDMDEIKNGYSPVGKDQIKYSMNEIENVLVKQCNDMGGVFSDDINNYNPNCWGTEVEAECKEMVNCQWTSYSYCKPETFYCSCKNGQKIYPIMTHAFEGACQ